MTPVLRPPRRSAIAYACGCLLLAALCPSRALAQQVVHGDLGVWDFIFESRRVDEVVHIPGSSWTEGPQVWENSVIFSDVLKNRVYRYNRRTGIHILLEDSGQASPADKEWMAEPGSNGIAMDPRRPGKAYVCQHGRHAVSRLDLLTGRVKTLATEYDGKRLNGPNDVVLDREARYAYFTDPIYAYLRKDAFHESEYLDEACQSNLGYKGVFRLRVDGPGHEPELLEGSRHVRPNGIAFSPSFSHLYVSDCCQGSHVKNCTQGDVVYTVYRVAGNGGLEFERSIRFRIEGEAGSRGCADGFKVHPKTGHIIASCPMGICIVGTGVAPEPSLPFLVGPDASYSDDDDGSDVEDYDAQEQSEEEDNSDPEAREGGGGGGDEEVGLDDGRIEESEELPGADGEAGLSGDPAQLDQEVGGGGADQQADEQPEDAAEAHEDAEIGQLEGTRDQQEEQGEADEVGPTESEVAEHKEEEQEVEGSPEEPEDSAEDDGSPAADEGSGVGLDTAASAEGTEEPGASAVARAAGGREGETADAGKPGEPERARTAAQPHRVRMQVPARRLLAVDEHEHSGGVPGEGRVGLLAHLELGHRVSNVVFGNDGFMYATGEARHGGGALMRIPLRHHPEEEEEARDELRRRAMLWVI